MAGLAAATLTRLGVGELVVASRTEAHALRLAQQLDGRAVPLTEAATVLAETDVLVSCTGATGVVLPLAVVAAARADSDRALAVVDLALPHDVDPTVAELPGVSLFDLARLAEVVNEDDSSDVAAVREIVSQEITSFLTARTSATVTPTVVALRTMATGIVDAEMQRLGTRLPGLDPDVRAEVEHAVRRVADKLLHQPTVRVKELANESGTVSYATALAELFSLDPDAVERVTSPTRGDAT
jgi:glutamyl-tRNA reductase